VFVSFGCADEHGSRDGTERALTTSSPASSQTPAAAPPTAPKKPNNSGVGCVPIHNLMEDAATAEISRSQLWQWVKHGARAQPSGRPVDAAWVAQLLQEECDAFRRQIGDARYSASKFEDAKRLLAGTIGGGPYSDFLTTLCYESICEPQARGALSASASAPRTPAPAPAMARL
jgi:hypothetical protein